MATSHPRSLTSTGALASGRCSAAPPTDRAGGGPACPDRDEHGRGRCPNDPRRLVLGLIAPTGSALGFVVPGIGNAVRDSRDIRRSTDVSVPAKGQSSSGWLRPAQPPWSLGPRR